MPMRTSASGAWATRGSPVRAPHCVRGSAFLAVALGFDPLQGDADEGDVRAGASGRRVHVDRVYGREEGEAGQEGGLRAVRRAPGPPGWRGAHLSVEAHG